jgi:cysteinyl-tRNA synthetase
MLKVYNTMSRKKEEFKPIRNDNVLIYTCGQTVYDDLHIGNARAYSNWDVVIRYLRYKGYNVLHVQNFTDVGHLTDNADSGEDKIEKSAKKKKISPWELVDTQIEKYYRDTDDLNVARASIMPRATSVIPEMIEMIEKLFKNGYAYESGGNVYFDTSKFRDYGKLARLKLDSKEVKARIAEDKNKKNYSDFGLWFNARKGKEMHVMNWPSPWGRGYPGWHLECSVMSTKFLGDIIDIHGGGIDHIPVHHTNEIAQCEGANGKTFVNYWMHGAFLTINGAKMSKSEGNFYTTRELIDRWGAITVRMALVSAHYRRTLDFGDNLLENAQNNLNKIREVFNNMRHADGNGWENGDKEIEELTKDFEESMDDDFNTPEAFAKIYKFTSKVNKNIKSYSKRGLEELSKALSDYLGILGINNELILVCRNAKTEELMKLIINIRDNARKNKDYKTSDKIRDELSKTGIQLQDLDNKTVWGDK